MQAQRRNLQPCRYPSRSPVDAAGGPATRYSAALLLALALILVWRSNFSARKGAFAAVTRGGFLFARCLIMPVCAVALLWPRYGAR